MRFNELVDFGSAVTGHAKNVFSESLDLGCDVAASLPKCAAHVVRRLSTKIGLKQHLQS